MTKVNLDEFQKTGYDDWLWLIKNSLKPEELKTIETQSYSGIGIKPLYTENDISDQMRRIIRDSGDFPYIRGKSAPDVKNHRWLIIQPLKSDNIFDLNKELAANLAIGQNSILIDFSLLASIAAQYDYSFADIFDILFKDIDLSHYPIFFENCVDYNFYQFFLSYITNNNIDKDTIEAAFGVDIFSKILNNGIIPITIDQDFEAISGMIKSVKSNHPKSGIVAINGNNYAEAGAGAIEEIAYSIAQAYEYMRQLERFDLNLDEIVNQIYFNFSAGSEFFIEIAKLRAARLLWAGILNKCGIDKSLAKMEMICQTSEFHQSFLDSDTNMIRNSIAAMSAIIGGSQGLKVNFIDTEYKNAEFAEFAGNLQLVLLNEAHLTDTIDPLGGSGYIENLTYQIAKHAYQLFVEIENRGGFLACLKDGYLQNNLNDLLISKKEQLANNKSILIGVNKYPNSNDKFLNNLSSSDLNNIISNLVNTSDDYDLQGNIDGQKINKLLKERPAATFEAKVFSN
ncbi:MAG: methylmalonyl-CoA mutase family protein [Candidatus Kapabacteria bacterium]|nr:methylmalonyl-CoA mutase family protein [Candidatus Kapabacteria bacterium]